MKIVNPLNYPLAVLFACICLVVGARKIKLSPWLMLPITVAISFVGAGYLAKKEPPKVNLNNPILEQELNNAKIQAKLLISKADHLRIEAQKLLQNSSQMELLTAVEYTCQRTLELPEKINHLTQKLAGGDSLLSREELNKQLQQVKSQQKNSKGRALIQLQQLENTLKNNLQLVEEGQDAREAQVFSIVTIITEFAGVLQQLQNKLRSANLDNSEEIQELKDLNNELNNFQESMDVLV